MTRKLGLSYDMCRKKLKVHYWVGPFLPLVRNVASTPGQTCPAPPFLETEPMDQWSGPEQAGSQQLPGPDHAHSTALGDWAQEIRKRKLFA